MRRQEERQDHQSKIFYELSSLILNILRSPPSPVDFSDTALTPVVRRSMRSRGEAMQQITLAGLASLMFGVSLSLMFCGSVTFLIGFMLMPWVIGLLLVFYVVGIVSCLSMLGRAVLCCTSSTPTPKDHRSSWKLL